MEESDKINKYPFDLSAYAFMRKWTLTRKIVDLFWPKEKGITLSFGAIAKELGIEKKKNRKCFSLDEHSEEELKVAIIELTKKRNVLYSRSAISEVYAMKTQHLWR